MSSHHQPAQKLCRLWPVWADTVMDAAYSEETGNGCSAPKLQANAQDHQSVVGWTHTPC